MLQFIYLYYYLTTQRGCLILKIMNACWYLHCDVTNRTEQTYVHTQTHIHIHKHTHTQA